jgi:hypothetical protein
VNVVSAILHQADVIARAEVGDSMVRRHALQRQHDLVTRDIGGAYVISSCEKMRRDVVMDYRSRQGLCNDENNYRASRVAR